MLFWNDGDLFYGITIPVDEKIKEEIYLVDEMIKIAESFADTKYKMLPTKGSYIEKHG
jgi:hypothetical protein